LEEAEATIHLERTMTIDQELADTTIHWNPNVETTRARETKYWNTMELYWHIKILLGQML
jgi:hypothetical protein